MNMKYILKDKIYVFIYDVHIKVGSKLFGYDGFANKSKGKEILAILVTLSIVC